MYHIRLFTRDADESYPEGLAYSIHMALECGNRTIPINRNYGLLFATALLDDHDCIVPRFLQHPAIAETENGWLISARIKDASIWDQWLTSDFCQYRPLGLSEKAPEGVASLVIPDEVAEKMISYWNDNAGAPFVVHPELPEGLSYPMAKGYGDPVFLHWQGQYYYIATNDKTDNIGLYIRSGNSIQSLFAPECEEKLLLDYNEEAGLMQTFWAPEFHVINGTLSIMFAVSGRQWGPQCHLMQLRENGRVDDPESWTNPVPIVRKDGSPLAGENTITLDMTCIPGKKLYVVWSQRRHIGTPLDTGSMLYIAELDEQQPWRLASDPVLLSRPLFGWENVAGTINNEGPYALLHNGKVYLTYSGGSANGFTYVIGLLTADLDADLLLSGNWSKAPTPVLSFASVPGEYGPGHNSFYRDDNGNLWIAYHTVQGYDLHERCVTMHRLDFA